MEGVGWLLTKAKEAFMIRQYRVLGLTLFSLCAMAACDAPADEVSGSSSAQAPESPDISRDWRDVQPPTTPGASVEEDIPDSDVPPPPRDVFVNADCAYEPWVGQPLDESAVKAEGRPFRILKPGDMMTMDHNPERINVEHEGGTVTRVWCG
jgi:hypothetical protein